jgi:hypothetical protein
VSVVNPKDTRRSAKAAEKRFRNNEEMGINEDKETFSLMEYQLM